MSNKLNLDQMLRLVEIRSVRASILLSSYYPDNYYAVLRKDSRAMYDEFGKYLLRLEQMKKEDEGRNAITIHLLEGICKNKRRELSAYLGK